MSYLAEKFKRTDALDMDEIIQQIENSFAIKFNSEDLNKVNSFQELAALTCDTIPRENIDSCTSQQTFYKFRKAYFATQNSKVTISPSSLLKELFPNKNRRKQIQVLEQEIGCKLNMLEPPSWITLSLLGLFIVSCILLFINTFYGVAGILISNFGFYIASKLGTVLKFHNVSDLVRSMERENYMQCRSSHSYNAKEVEKLIIQIYTENLDLDSSKFNSNTAFS
jgi:hypothetical protein